MAESVALDELTHSKNIALNYEIISRIKAQPFMWLFSHRFYGNRKKIKIFWKEVSRELGIEETKLKKRWKHLKDQFRKEKKKAIEKGVPDSGVVWQYYDSLVFLNEEMTMRDKERAAAVGIETATEDESSESDTFEKQEAPKVRVVEARPDETTRILHSINRKLTETKTAVEERIRTYDEGFHRDPDYMYLVSLLPSLKHLSEIQKLQLKGKINDWLLEAITTNQYINQCDTKYLVTEVAVDMQK